MNDIYDDKSVIPTWYKGLKFRGRTEARWGVFFDAARIEWEYEPNRYRCFCYNGEEPLTYLPDFYLPKYNVYAEVKGTDKQLFASSAKIGRAIDYNATPVANGLILLGNIPFLENMKKIGEIDGSFLYWDEGVVLGDFTILEYYYDSLGMEFVKSAKDVDSTSCIPKMSSIDFRIYESDYDDSLINRAFMLARSARFDFDDSVAKMLEDGRDIIGGYSDGVKHKMADPCSYLGLPF